MENFALIPKLPSLIKLDAPDESQREDYKIPLAPGLVEFVYPQVDPLGQVFCYGDNIFRGIHQDALELVQSYFSSGLIQALQEKNLIPKTQIVPYEFSQYPLIIQHEKINNISYPWEWSFTMLKDAALLCIDVMEELLARGFTARDGHPYNIAFKDNKPVWMDLTTFVKNDFKTALGMLQFFPRLYLPLKIMALQPPMGRKILYDSELPWGVMVFRTLACKYGLRMKKQIVAATHRYDKLFVKQAAQTDMDKIRKGLERYRQRIKSLQLDYKTCWDQYNNDWIDEDKKIVLKLGRTRFVRLLNIMNLMPIKSVIEFAANEGVSSSVLATSDKIEKIVAVDYDENCVDTLYKSLSEHRLPECCVKKIFPMVIDFKEALSFPPMRINLAERVKADAVVALALSHHLLLTQGMDILEMFDKFSKFTKRFIFIEFMPLGIWDGGDKLPPVPDWYTEEWFVKNMEKKFKIILRQELQSFRILFVGELRNSQ